MSGIIHVIFPFFGRCDSMVGFGNKPMQGVAYHIRYSAKSLLKSNFNIAHMH